jgi:hypothetical protein
MGPSRVGLRDIPQLLCSLAISSTALTRIAVGVLCGLRESGLKAASPMSS